MSLHFRMQTKVLPPGTGSFSSARASLGDLPRQFSANEARNIICSESCMCVLVAYTFSFIFLAVLALL